MNRYFITLRSITPAQHAQKLLHEIQIESTVQRTPRFMEAQGCGYRLTLQPEQLAPALECLKQHRIPYRKVYLQSPDGSIREVSP